jgi:signal transduction histidine kinase
MFTTLATQASAAIYQHQMYASSLKAQQQVEAILNSIDDGVLVLGSDRRIQRHNLALLQILGLGREQLVGKRVDAASEQEGLKRLADILVRHPDSAHQTHTYRLVLEQPSRTDIDVSISTVLDHSKDWITIVSLHDRSAALAQLHTWTSVARAAARDVRSGVEVIRGYATLVVGHQARQDDPTHSWGAQIRAQSARLSLLSADLADLAAIEEDRLEVRSTEVALDALFQEAVDLAHSLALRNEATIEQRYPPNLPLLSLDRERLVRVLWHLLDLALQRAEPGAYIGLRAEVTLEELTVTLTDEGEPLAAEWVERVLAGRYHLNGEALEDPAGSGLGLYISARIVRALQGQIWAPEASSRGARLQLIIPLKRI